MTVLVTKGDYEDATEAYQGWCPACEEFTRDSTEPDDEDYDCPACGDAKVVGAEQALLLGLIEIED